MPSARGEFEVKLISQSSPDSGTGELIGLTGTMKIDIVDGKHFYEFGYALPEAKK